MEYTLQKTRHIRSTISVYTYYSLQSRNRSDRMSAMIRKFKRDPAENPALAWEFADALAIAYKTIAVPNAIVVPVPSDPTRSDRNGIDPVLAILYAGFGAFVRSTGARIVRALVRVRSYPDLRSVTGYRKRSAIVRDAFSVNATLLPEVKGKRVILFDDIVTTGATTNECARVLTEAGVREIHLLALAASARFKSAHKKAPCLCVATV